VLGAAGHERDDVRRAVLDLYVDTRARLAGSSPAAALGFGLGRMLADTVLLPAPGDPRALGDQFSGYRLANAYAWLNDLDARLPAHSAAATRVSLKAWEQWVAGRRRLDGATDPVKLDGPAVRALHRQGELWRRLLTGEQSADQLLDGHAYVGAAASLLENSRRIAFHYLWRWSWAITATAGAAAVTLWAAVTYAPAGTDRMSAVLVSGAGFLGLSWAGARATLGTALRQAEGAIWESGVVAAIGKAATIIPEKRKDSSKPPGAASETTTTIPQPLGRDQWQPAAISPRPAEHDAGVNPA
jgi:hypothetical protein